MALRFTVLSLMAGLLLSCSEHKQSDKNAAASSKQIAVSTPETAGPDSTEAIRPGPRLADNLRSNAEELLRQAKYDSTLIHFEQAASLYEASENWEKLVLCYNKLGECSWRKRVLDQANGYLDRGLEIGLNQLGEKHPEIANNYHHKGVIHFIKGEYEEALTWLNRAVSLDLSIFGEQHPDVARSYDIISVIYQTRGDYSRAFEYCNKAIAIQLTTLGELHPEVAQSYNSLASIHLRQGNYDSAIDLFNKSLAIRMTTLGEQHPEVSRSYNNLGIIYAEKGDYAQAIHFLEHALSIKLKTLGEHHNQVANSYLNLGVLYYNKGDYEQALTVFNKAIAILRASLGEHHPVMANSYENLAGAYDALGDFDRALEYYEKATAIRRTAFGEKHPDVAKSYSNLGRTYAQKGEVHKSLSYHGKALQLALATLGKDHPQVASEYQYYGQAYAKKGDYDGALSLLDKALKIRLTNFGENHPLVAESYNAMAEIYMQKMNYDRAIELSQQALHANAPEFAAPEVYANPSLKNIPSETELLTSLEQKAAALASRYSRQRSEVRDLETAVSTYRRAAQLIDQMRTGFKAEGSKLLLADRATSIYEQAIRAALELHNVAHDFLARETAFTFAEKTKASILLDAFVAAEARKFANLPESLFEQERQLRIDLAFYDNSLTEEKLKKEEGDSARIALWQDKVFTLKQQYDALLERFEKDYPDYYNLRYQTKTASVQKMQQMLDDNTALIEYFTGQDSIFIFTIAKDAFDVVAVAKDSLFGQRAKDFRNAIIDKDLDQYTRSAFLLYQTLVAPVKNRLTAERLIIVPDAEISTVPFEALLTEQVARGKLQDYEKLPYLVNDHAISYAYSATLLLEEQKKQKSPAKNDYLAFAPVFPQGLPAGTRGADLMHENLKSDSLRTANRLRSYLPATRKEVTSIEEIFAGRQSFFDRLFGGTSKVYLEQEANEPHFKAPEVRDYRYVHFATHAFVNEQNPKLSGLLLAQEQDSAAQEDGVVHLGEIYNLNLNADLVVLSACETGLGKIAKGEGIIGLTRGFLYAGASNLLVSLWQVSDASTADLMVDFYSGMLSGAGKAEALREAKHQLIHKNPEYAKPYYWAPFVLIGR